MHFSVLTNNIHVNVKNSSAEVVLQIELLSQVVQTETSRVETPVHVQHGHSSNRGCAVKTTPTKVAG